MPLVKPDATPEEVKAVVNDESGGQIFQQAVRLVQSGQLKFFFAQLLSSRSWTPIDLEAREQLTAKFRNDMKISSVSKRLLRNSLSSSMMCVSSPICYFYWSNIHVKMSVLVAEQDETIQNIETQAATVEKDTEAG